MTTSVRLAAPRRRRGTVPWLIALVAGTLATGPSVGMGAESTVRPRPGHPGNIFLRGETVEVRFPTPIPAEARSWRALDVDRTEVADGAMPPGVAGAGDRLRVGALGVGWYRIELLDAAGATRLHTTAAVLEPMRETPPESTPIAVDSAAAWFAAGDRDGQADLASIAALAGVRWIRDRLRWREIEPRPGELIDRSTYDSSSEEHRRQGLRVLEVFHDTPPWATDPALDGSRARGRFPRDLRVVYRSCRALARRFRGRVAAWEPWNEANVETFGGHTVDEMCSFQKAAWLGLKAGDPELTVCWNAYTGAPTERHADGVLANEAWPYFDVYSIHSYDWPSSYADLWKPVRRAACGRPIWVTEADRGYRHEGQGPWYELSAEGERRKAEYMTHAYACSMWAGSARHFHFVLGHYTESRNGVQFGLLRLDRTPRPSYVALAALGRRLAGARCLGRLRLEPDSRARVIAFRARPGGRSRDVLVAWSEAPGDWSAKGTSRAPSPLPATLPVVAVHDHLGRLAAASAPRELRDAAWFITMPEGAAERLDLEPPLRSAARREGPAASPIVLQLERPHASVRKIDGPRWSHGYEHTVPAGRPSMLSVVVYNLSAEPHAGSIRVEAAPPGCSVRIRADDTEIALDPLEARRLQVEYRGATARSDEPDPANGAIRLRGEFGLAGRPVLSFRLAPVPSE